MFTPLVLILIYLSSTFLLGLALGWLLWKLGASQEMESMSSEVSFWKKYLEQARRERDQDQDKIASLEQQRDSLKRLIASAKTPG